MKKNRPFFLILLVVLSTSCSYQNIFENKQQNDLKDLITKDSTYQHIITVDDKLSVSVWNHDNMSIGSLFGIYSSNQVYGKWVLVDAAGYIMVPKIGRVRLGGLTCLEAADTLATLYSEILVDPNLVVKVLNRDVTILGEVRTPGKYILEKEGNTLTEIIGNAQGFEFYADKKKIQLIRNNKSYRIDFTKLMDNNYQILVQAGDVINVPTRRGKSIDKKAPTLIPFASALTALAVIVSVITR
ncbi:MAG: polysaccharide export protein [Flavobacteriales bacterium]|nr:polysaccharide export protein [Flavobacteriales bacterium]